MSDLMSLENPEDILLLIEAIELLSEAAQASLFSGNPLDDTSHALDKVRDLSDGNESINFICHAIFENACASHKRIAKDGRNEKKREQEKAPIELGGKDQGLVNPQQRNSDEDYSKC